jgi:hypothetical protein
MYRNLFKKNTRKACRVAQIRLYFICFYNTSLDAPNHFVFLNAKMAKRITKRFDALKKKKVKMS